MHCEYKLWHNDFEVIVVPKRGHNSKLFGTRTMTKFSKILKKLDGENVDFTKTTEKNLRKTRHK